MKNLLLVIFVFVFVHLLILGLYFYPQTGKNKIVLVKNNDIEIQYSHLLENGFVPISKLKGNFYLVSGDGSKSSEILLILNAQNIRGCS